MPGLNTPDFSRIRDMWRRYWARDPGLRPLVINSVSRGAVPKGTINYHASHYRYALTGDYDGALAQIDLILKDTEYLGEALPYFSPDHGPDQFAAFMGTDLKYKPESAETNWAHPVIHDWTASMPLALHQDSRAWQGMLEYSRKLAKHAAGRYAVAVADLHSNMDALAALRGPQNLCMDLMTCPDVIEEAMRQVRRFYVPVYESLYDAGSMAETGAIGWAPFYCEGRFATIQCDFICMVSPEIARQMIIPALDEESSFLDHCVYHLDGPAALAHLDDILALKHIDVIQWVPGAGQKPQYEWMEVLKKCRKAGKGLQLWDIDGLERVKMLCRELGTSGLVLCCGCGRDETMRIIDWLDKNGQAG